eukprot:gene15634-biopygen8389
MVSRMRRLQNRTKIMRPQKPGRMRNVRNTGELAGRLWKAVDCCRRLMKSRGWRRTVEVLSLMQVSKAFGDREGQGMLSTTHESAEESEDPESVQSHAVDWRRRGSRGRARRATEDTVHAE